jgi:hypothetical protein
MSLGHPVLEPPALQPPDSEPPDLDPLTQNVEMAASLPQLRVVAGGTGSFIGARGQLTTTRISDGTYRHEFTPIDG